MQNKRENLADPTVKRRFITYREAAELYGIGLTRLQEHAKMSGNKVLVNTEIFEAYLEQFRIPGEFEGLAKKYINLK